PVPPPPKFTPGAGDVVEKMSPMRKRIAEHMVASRRTSAHVHSVFEVNFSRLAQIRESRKADFERSGAKLTYMAFIIKGAVDALFGTPIINQRQVAILGVGNVEKRPVVIEDAIAIRPMAYLTLGYDHRVIDGAVADHYMSHLKKQLENWDPNTV